VIVLFVSLRDLQWRLRRFLIGVLAAGLVFALTLLMSGVSASFGTEIRHSVAAFGIDAWVVPSDVSGPFTSSRVFPASEASQVASRPGVRGADPVLLMRTSVGTKPLRDLNVVGVVAGGIVQPKLTGGRPLRRSGDMIADQSLGLGLGSTVFAFGRRFTIVGRMKGVTLFAGTPVAFVPLADLQAAALDGAPLANTVVVRGSIASPLAGYRVLSNAQVRSDLSRPMHAATQTIDFVMTLLWIVAAGIIGSILYLQAIERSRDFAVFKATGVTTRTLLWGLALQAVALALCAALAAYVLAYLLTPAMSMAVAVPQSAYVALPVIAVVVGLIASLVALRRAVTIDPALAFGG
jgi:putative ABC transport system permease protein